MKIYLCHLTNKMRQLSYAIFYSLLQHLQGDSENIGHTLKGCTACRIKQFLHNKSRS